MPCRDDWPDPSHAQKRSQQAAKLLIYLYEKMGKHVFLSEKLAQDARDCYCNTDWVKVLCALLKGMSQEERESYIYVARDKQARALADWWEEHQEVDRLREEMERQREKRQELRLGALKKLTREEIEALEISDYRIGQWMKGKD